MSALVDPLTQSVIRNSNLVFVLTVSDFGPAMASNVVVSDVLPAGATYLSSSVSQGAVSTNADGSLTWTVGDLLKGAQASMTLSVQPTLVGTAVNSATVTNMVLDLNPSDNTASASANVVAPTAELALDLVSGPNAVVLGGTYALTATVTNLGPASAPGLTILFYLDPNASFVSASPASWTLDAVNNIVTFTNFGPFGSNSIASASVVARPTVGPATNLTFATCYSEVVDPFKSSADGAVKTVVTAPLAVTLLIPAPQTLVLTWPAAQGAVQVQTTPSLIPPIQWTTVTNPAPSLVNGQYSFTNSIGSGSLFFRLSRTTP